MNEANEKTFIELAIALFTTLDIPHDGHRQHVAALALRTAYQSGVLAGVDLAEAGIEFAAQVDAEEYEAAAASPLGRALVEAALEGTDAQR